MNYTDEDLNALLDGELSSAEAEQIQRAMQHDTELAERYAALLMAESQYCEAISLIDNHPLPTKLAELLTGNSRAEDQDADLSEPLDLTRDGFGSRNLPTLSAWPHRLAEFVHWFSPVKFAAVAASAMFGLLMIQQLATPPAADQDSRTLELLTQYGEIPDQHPASALLSNAPSGLSNQVSDGISLTPVLSFESISGSYCREFITQSQTDSYRSVACLNNGDWRVIIVSNTRFNSDANNYQTASSLTPSVFEEKVNSLLASEPLDAKQELSLIERDWKYLPPNPTDPQQRKPNQGQE